MQTTSRFRAPSEAEVASPFRPSAWGGQTTKQAPKAQSFEARVAGGHAQTFAAQFGDVPQRVAEAIQAFEDLRAKLGEEGEAVLRHYVAQEAPELLVLVDDSIAKRTETAAEATPRPQGPDPRLEPAIAEMKSKVAELGETVDERVTDELAKLITPEARFLVACKRTDNSIDFGFCRKDRAPAGNECVRRTAPANEGDSPTHELRADWHGIRGHNFGARVIRIPKANAQSASRR